MKNKKIIFYVIPVLIVVIVLTIFLIFRKIPSATLKHKHEVSSEKSKKQLYHCPMHPTYISDKPGDCPICGMRLVPMKEEDVSDKKHDTAGISGQAGVTISPEREQLIGVKTDTVKKHKLVFKIRATARIAHDPELYNAIIEYQRAISARDEIKKANPLVDVLKQTESLVKSSYLKLRHLGLSENQIKEMSKEELPTNLIMVGNSGGTVWVYAQIYEYEIGLVKPGQMIEVTSVSLPGKKFSGEIKSIDTYLDAETRSLRVRAEVSNEEGLLKPDMFVDATINVDLGEKLAIPEDAVLDSGTRQIVFIKKAAGKYEPREVKLGHEADGFYEVISGVDEGEKIVTSANFLIDSESKLKSAIQGMGEHKHGQ